MDQPQYEYINGQWEPINPNKPKSPNLNYGDNQYGSGGKDNVAPNQLGSEAVIEELKNKGQLDQSTVDRLNKKNIEKPVDDTEGFKKVYKPSVIEIDPNEKYTADKLKAMDDDKEFSYHFNVDKLMQDRLNLTNAAARGQQIKTRQEGPIPPFPSQQGTQDFNQAFNQSQQPAPMGPPAPDFIPQMEQSPHMVSPQVAKDALLKNQQGKLFLSPENIIKFKQIAGIK